MLLLRLLNVTRVRPVWHSLPQRTITSWKTSAEVENMLKRLDHVPRTYELVYRQKHYTVGGLMYHFTNFIAFVTLGAIGYFYYMRYYYPDYKMPKQQVELFKPYQATCLIAMNVGMLILAHTTRLRWPIRIYHDPNRDVYRVIRHSVVPFHQEFYEFTGKSVSYVSRKSILPWRHCLYRIDNGKKILLYDEKFKSPYHFHQMLKPDEL